MPPLLVKARGFCRFQAHRPGISRGSTVARLVAMPRPASAELGGKMPPSTAGKDACRYIFRQALTTFQVAHCGNECRGAPPKVFGHDAMAARFWKQAAWRSQGAFNRDTERMVNDARK